MVRDLTGGKEPASSSERQRGGAPAKWTPAKPERLQYDPVEILQCTDCGHAEPIRQRWDCPWADQVACEAVCSLNAIHVLYEFAKAVIDPVAVGRGKAYLCGSVLPAAQRQNNATSSHFGSDQRKVREAHPPNTMQQEETSADLTPRLRRLTQNHSLITRAFAALSLFSIYTVATFYDTPGERN